MYLQVNFAGKFPLGLFVPDWYIHRYVNPGNHNSEKHQQLHRSDPRDYRVYKFLVQQPAGILPYAV